MSEFRSTLRTGEPVVGSWISIGHPTVAEISATPDFEFATVDVEHAPVSIETVENLVRAIDAAPGSTAPVVRVSSADPVAIKRVLDTGPAGIMVPRVDTADEARAVVRATRYPPEGIRGTAAARASRWGEDLPDYLERADESIARIVQIETERAVENAAAIAEVEGVDALFVGPADLSAAVGTRLEYDSPEFEAAVERVVEAGESTNTPVGIFATDPDRFQGWLDQGFDFGIVGFDAAYLFEGNRRRLDAFREATGQE